MYQTLVITDDSYKFPLTITIPQNFLTLSLPVYNFIQGKLPCYAIESYTKHPRFSNFAIFMNSGELMFSCVLSCSLTSKYCSNNAKDYILFLKLLFAE